MGLLLSIIYNSKPVTYDVTVHENEIYHLHLISETAQNKKYIPEKIVIRKKGKIWISDLEDYNELIDKLTTEINNYKLSA